MSGRRGGPTLDRNLRHTSFWTLLPVPAVASLDLQMSCSGEVGNGEVSCTEKQGQSKVHLLTQTSLYRLRDESSRMDKHHCCCLYKTVKLFLSLSFTMIVSRKHPGTWTVSIWCTGYFKDASFRPRLPGFKP